MMPIGRMRPEDFDAVFRLLAQSFPAGAQGTVDCADLLSMAMQENKSSTVPPRIGGRCAVSEGRCTP